MQCHECHAELPAEARFCLSCGTRVQLADAEGPSDPLRDALDSAIGFQYRIERLLGRGGMGAVYLAHELALERDVAIKVLPPEQAGTPQLRERFKREARTAARLRHPNIVPLHTFGEVSGLLYFVMGYVAGESLADRLQRHGAFDSESARTMLAATCDALDYAHRQGIVHRDIKPDNILIDAASGAPLLTDFGIAKAALADAHLTTAGQVIGTPHYMSPEQAMGRADVGPRSDLYSLGIVAYEMLSGQRPFQAETPLEALSLRLTQEPRPLASLGGGLAHDLVQAIDRCLQKDPSKRWPDAKSLREALLPTEEEADDPQLLRVLRNMVTIVLPLITLALAYLAMITALHPQFQAAGRIGSMLWGMATGIVVTAAVAAVRLRAQGLAAKTIAMRLLQQPRWWRGWYPRAWRRRGDVWDRLPREFRQSRLYRGLFLIYMFAVFLPVWSITTWDERLPALRAGLALLAAAGLALLFALRRRALTKITADSQTTVAEAMAILNTPSWRVSAWRKSPTASLLVQPESIARQPESKSQTVATQPGAGTVDVDAERSTRLS